MRICWLAIYSVILMPGAQVRSVGIKPGAPLAAGTAVPNLLAGAETRTSVAGPPVLGYVLGPAPAELHAILGTAKAPQLGGSIAVPENSKRLYLPPRQLYAIVEQSSDDPVAVWRLGTATLIGEKDLLTPIKGGMAHPDLVAFSPRGESAALYSKTLGSLQVVVDLPAKPAIREHFSVALVGELIRIAVTDDGSLIVTEDVTGQVQFATDKGWRPLSGDYAPLAWSFLPKTHDLVVSDATQKTITLVENVSEAPTAVHILAQGMRTDHLTVTKDGDVIATADSRNGKVWTIQLKTGTVTPVLSSAKVDSLSSLRDGRTFLLSSSPVLSLLKPTASSESPVVSLDSGITSESPAAQSSPHLDLDCLCFYGIASRRFRVASQCLHVETRQGGKTCVTSALLI